MNKEVFRITGINKDGIEKEFEYTSTKEAAFHNPGFTNFKIVGQETPQDTFKGYH